MNFFQMLNLQLQLLLLIIIGIIIKRMEIINSEQQKGISSLLIKLILPSNIIHSFISGLKINSDLIINCAWAIGISLFIQLFATLLSHFIFKRFNKTKANVMSYGMIVSNSSFIGIPVVENIYGAIGTLYTSVFQIPIRITMWTAGLSLYTDEKNLKKKIKKMLIHPCIIAVFLGFLLLIIQIPIPSLIVDTISILSKCTTPMSMLIIGAILADIDWKNLFDFSAIYYTLFRLIIFPLFILMILHFTPVDQMIKSIAIIMTGMPAGSTTAILAQQYNYDYKYAAKIILISTLASIITIPLLTLLL